MTETRQITGLISKISAEAGALAPEKSGGVPFPFRGIDSTINHLSPHLEANGVIVIPTVIDRVTTMREIGSKALTQTDLLAEFKFIAPDGSYETARTIGLAQDYADRSAAQAQSVAYRVALLQVFHLPTQQTEPEVAGEQTAAETERLTEGEAKKTGTAKVVDTVASIRATILNTIISDPNNSFDGPKVNAFATELTGKPSDKWTVADLNKILTGLRKEVAKEQK
jgi:hypothetical protein